MTLEVWKFPLENVISVVEMPSGAEILHVALQRNTPCLWARVDNSAPKERRGFAIVGTGHPCPPGTHIGTFLINNGEFVFHVFESTERP